MNNQDIQKVIHAIELRGMQEDDTSGPFVEVLREFIRVGKIAEVAMACRLYFSAFPPSRQFVAKSLYALILNHHPCFRDRLDTPSLLEWQKRNSNFRDEIERNASSSRLIATVQSMMLSVHEFLFTE